MKHTTPIAILALSAALTLASCDVNRHTPEPEDQKVPLSFSALSQTTPTKADGTTPFNHSDFGVWGIARKTGNTQPYILWEAAVMSPVIKSGSGYYPQDAAYWISGYKYKFIAIAPWEDWQGVESSISVTSTSGSEKVQFDYDMAAKYGNDDTQRDLDFDLMAAVGHNEVVGPAASHSSVQDLNFHHLLARVCIAVNFEGTTGTVDEMRLLNVDTKAIFDISFNASNAINIGYTPVSNILPALTADEMNLVIKPGDQDEDSKWPVHILPQKITDFELYLDFSIGGVKTENFKINLEAAKYDKEGNAVEYLRNKWYNWNITINPRGISFDVSVEPWADVVPDNADDFVFDFEDEQGQN